MKIDRLLAITILLLNRRRMTAKDLADHFEVSVRTIYRDVETLNRSGIPVITYQGHGGGLCIPDHYKLSRQLLTFSDMVSILTTLKGVNRTLKNQDIDRAIEKITSLIPDEKEALFKQRADSFLVDLEPWGASGRGRDIMATVHEGVTRSNLITFAYTKPGSAPEERIVEPYTLAFKGWSWYLLAFCRTRSDFRIFKLRRMRDIRLLPEHFVRKEISPADHFGTSYDRSEKLSFTLLINEKIHGQMSEYVPSENMVPDPGDGDSDGRRWRVTMSLPENEWLYGFLLSLGPDARVVSPARLRQILAKKIHQMKKNYSNLTQGCHRQGV
ncbi:MAG: YafY family transcriptional regulator [Desulfobacterales bacterium]|nr:YafY family transcriptional regulator [Desulfobacterales bacterium]